MQIYLIQSDFFISALCHNNMILKRNILFMLKRNPLRITLRTTNVKSPKCPRRRLTITPPTIPKTSEQNPRCSDQSMIVPESRNAVELEQELSSSPTVELAFWRRPCMNTNLFHVGFSNPEAPSARDMSFCFVSISRRQRKSGGLCGK